MMKHYRVTVWKYNPAFKVSEPFDYWFNTYKSARQAYNIAFIAMGFDCSLSDPLPKRMDAYQSIRLEKSDKLDAIEIKCL